MPRFVILRHEGPAPDPNGVHWDLMLEQAGTLRTWALAEEPALGRQVAARQLPDHRLHYLNYEGPISAGRGQVSRWDSGEYELAADGPDELVARLRGIRLAGTAILSRTSADAQRWLFRLSDPV